MTANKSCVPAVISISTSHSHMTLIPLYYATKRSPCRYSLLLSVKHCRHLQKIPNGTLKDNSASFLCFTPGLRPCWIISIFTASFPQGPFPSQKTGGFRPKTPFSLESTLWQKSSKNDISKNLTQPIKTKHSSSQAIRSSLPPKNAFNSS